MAGIPSQDAQKKERAAMKQERAAARAQKAESRAKRDAERKEKAAGKGRPARLCSLATVDVKKAAEGFTISVSTSSGRKSLLIPPNETSQVLRDLSTAIEVIRGQQ